MGVVTGFFIAIAAYLAGGMSGYRAGLNQFRENEGGKTD